jgi:hypothetical protein
VSLFYLASISHTDIDQRSLHARTPSPAFSFSDDDLPFHATKSFALTVPGYTKMAIVKKKFETRRAMENVADFHIPSKVMEMDHTRMDPWDVVARATRSS